MQILVTIPEGPMREDFFPPRLRARLEALGDVRWNPLDRDFDATELRERADGVDVLVTGWGSPQVDETVLSAATGLDLVAHTGGSVAEIASAAAYDRGVRVASANEVMAEHVAEHLLGAVIAHVRSIPELDRRLKAGGGWDADDLSFRTLHGETIGLVGLGTIGRLFVDHLEAFDVDVRVYDPYVDDATLAEWAFVERVDLETALSSSVVSVHASRTPETIGMLGADELATIPDGAVFVNTARAEIVVEEPLLAELRSGRLSAVLDVYHEEPLPEEHELRSLDNVTLTPHTAGSRIRPPLTAAMIDEIERLRDGRDLAYEIPREQWARMTR